jgi:hypothetical protein
VAFSKDTFSGEIAGTALQAHTGEYGAAWTSHSSGTKDVLISAAAQCYSPGAGTGFYYSSGVPAGAEYSVGVDLIVVTSPAANIFAGPAGRIDVAANTMYLVRHQTQATDRFELVRVVAGVFTTLGSFNVTLTVGNTYNARLEILDATKKLFLDGVQVISSADNIITAAGRAGIRFSGATTDTTAIHVDNFFASTRSEPLALSVTGAAAVTPALGRRRKFELAVAGISTFTNIFVRLKSLALTTTGLATADFGMKRGRGLVLSIVGNTNAAKEFKRRRNVQIAITGVATYSPALRVNMRFDLSIAGAGAYSPDLRRRRTFATPISGTGTVSMALNYSAAFAVGVTGAASFDSEIARTRHVSLGVQGAGSGTGNAMLSLTRSMNTGIGGTAVVVFNFEQYEFFSRIGAEVASRKFKARVSRGGLAGAGRRGAYKGKLT